MVASHCASSRRAYGSTTARGGGDEYGPSSVLHYVIPVGRSWQSVVAPYLGLASLVSLPVVGHACGVAGIALGIVAMALGTIGLVTSTLFLLSIV